jgi:hypothetical protein
MEKYFTVWVGGLEINDYLLTEQEAESLAQKYKNDGYTDTILERVK